jgi:hypothetical protein
MPPNSAAAANFSLAAADTGKSRRRALQHIIRNYHDYRKFPILGAWKTMLKLSYGFETLHYLCIIAELTAKKFQVDMTSGRGFSRTPIFS